MCALWWEERQPDSHEVCNWAPVSPAYFRNTVEKFLFSARQGFWFLSDTSQDLSEVETSFRMPCFINRYLLTLSLSLLSDSGLLHFLFRSSFHGLCVENQQKGSLARASHFLLLVVSGRPPNKTRPVSNYSLCRLSERGRGEARGNPKALTTSAKCSLWSSKRQCPVLEHLLLPDLFVKMNEHVLSSRDQFLGRALFCW